MGNNGKLSKITYGNGFIEEYVYNRLEKLSEIWYTKSGTRTKAYSYEYTSDAKLHKYIDHRSGRLIDTVEYKNADLIEDFVTTRIYDKKNRPSGVFHNINYTASGELASFNSDYTFTYGDRGVIESFTASTNAATGNEYDGSFNGKIIKWRDPTTGREIFEWDEDYERGPHYHILTLYGNHKKDHILPGTPVPEPYNSIYFGGYNGN